VLADAGPGHSMKNDFRAPCDGPFRISIEFTKVSKSCPQRVPEARSLAGVCRYPTPDA
jgi:hypothetical protein